MITHMLAPEKNVWRIMKLVDFLCVLNFIRSFSRFKHRGFFFLDSEYRFFIL